MFFPPSFMLTREEPAPRVRAPRGPGRLAALRQRGSSSRSIVPTTPKPSRVRIG